VLPVPVAEELPVEPVSLEEPVAPFDVEVSVEVVLEPVALSSLVWLVAVLSPPA
jgi:hypothetical protein